MTVTRSSTLLSTGSLTLANNFILDNSNLTVGPAAGTTLTLSGNIFDGAGAGGLIVNATGATLELTATNTYSGGTILNGGTLRLLDSGALGTVQLTANGSTIIDYDGILNVANAIVLQGTTQYQVLAGTATQSGAISENTGPRSLEKTGAGTLILAGANASTRASRRFPMARFRSATAGPPVRCAGDIVNNAALAVNRSNA